MLKNNSLTRNIIIALGVALVVVAAIVALARYSIVRDKQRIMQKPPMRSVSAPAPAPISDEVLRSLTPTQNATTTAVSKEMLDSLTPPKDAKPAQISQSVLDSLTPPTK